MQDTESEFKKPTDEEPPNQSFVEVHCQRCGADRGQRFGRSDGLGNAILEVRCASCSAPIPHRRQGESALITDGGATVRSRLTDLREKFSPAAETLRYHQGLIEAGDTPAGAIVVTLQYARADLALRVEHDCGTEYLRYVETDDYEGWVSRLVNDETGTRPLMDVSSDTPAIRLKDDRKDVEVILAEQVPVSMTSDDNDRQTAGYTEGISGP